MVEPGNRQPAERLVGVDDVEAEFANFGRNVRFRPRAAYRPQSEAEVLEILSNHRGERIRAIGRLHSWSETAAADEVLLDLRHLNDVRIAKSPAGVQAEIGGGCQIKRALRELNEHGYTLPSVGLISEQTIAGAAATGTHGSGRQSLSHYITAVRVAHYDPATGEPTIRTIDGGDELLAVGCGLGCLGIVLAVTVPIREQYFIEEHLREYGSLDDVLAAEPEFPLQQFFLIPWRWTFLAQHRREVDAPRSWHAPIYRAYWFATIDVGLHVLLVVLSQVLRAASLLRVFYRWLVLAFVVRGWRVVDRSDRQLIMEHELFRHIEVELFVRRRDLPRALPFVASVLSICGGQPDRAAGETTEQFASLGLGDELAAVAGRYTHHYAICVRKVLADVTLISPASGQQMEDPEEPWYAISLISYQRPNGREHFFRVARLIAASMAQLYGARPHWGKYCPLSAAELEPLYPRLADFRAISRQCDPTGRFQNRWTNEAVMGTCATETSAGSHPTVEPVT
jgi:FAD/FMN-containing dehydrogenase